VFSEPTIPPSFTRWLLCASDKRKLSIADLRTAKRYLPGPAEGGVGEL
jgi:hypothetical protein